MSRLRLKRIQSVCRLAWIVAAGVGVGAIASEGFAGEGGKNPITDCDIIADAVRRAAEKEPTKVLVILEEALKKEPDCTCDIVKAAILGSEADKALVKQIVMTSVRVHQSQSATIGECCAEVAPEAAAEIMAGLREALGPLTLSDDRWLQVWGYYTVTAVAPGNSIENANLREELDKALDRIRTLLESVPPATASGLAPSGGSGSN